MSLETEVLKRITPTPEESEAVQAVVEKLFKRVEKEIERVGADAHPILVGSVAKGTYLKNPEIDMFVAFNPETPREDLERMGLEIGQRILGGETRYAEHPYTRGTFNGFETEIVPCYDIQDPTKKMSAVDRTPFHTQYVLQHLTEQLIQEVRLFKQFSKGIGVYGAEAKVQGLSGYLCELLVIKFGGFQALLRNVTEWKPGTLIEFEEKAKKRFKDPLIVIDPVDPGRNVASALNLDCLALLAEASKAYLSNPRMEFFFPNRREPMSRQKILREMRKRGTRIIGIKLSKPDVVEDVLYPQLRRCEKATIRLCERSGFSVLRYASFVDESDILLLLEFEVHKLPEVTKHEGPPFASERSAEFVEKWRGNPKTLSGPYLKDGKWFVEIRRKHTSAEAMLREELLKLSLGKDINLSASRGFEILDQEQVVQERWLQNLTEYFDTRFPWEL